MTRHIDEVCKDIDNACSYEEFTALRDELKPQIKMRPLVESQFIAEHFKEKYGEFIETQREVYRVMKELFDF